MRRMIVVMMLRLSLVGVVLMRVVVRVVMRGIMRMLMIMFMGVIVIMRVVRVLMTVLMGVRVVRMVIVRAVLVRMLDLSGILFRNNVHLCCGNTTAVHFAHLKARANIQGRGSLREHCEGDTSIHQRAQHHVATDPGKALQIANTHRFVILA